MEPVTQKSCKFPIIQAVSPSISTNTSGPSSRGQEQFTCTHPCLPLQEIRSTAPFLFIALPLSFLSFRKQIFSSWSPQWCSTVLKTTHTSMHVYEAHHNLSPVFPSTPTSCRHSAQSNSSTIMICSSLTATLYYAFPLYVFTYLTLPLLKAFATILYLANTIFPPSQGFYCEIFPNSPFPLDPVSARWPSFTLSNHTQGLSHCSPNIFFKYLPPLATL